MLTVFSGDFVMSLFDDLLYLHESRLGNNRQVIILHVVLWHDAFIIHAFFLQLNYYLVVHHLEYLA